MDSKSSRQARACYEKTVDSEGPSNAQMLDESVEDNTHDCTTGATTSEDDAVSKASSAKEVLCWSNGDCREGESGCFC